MSDYGLSPQQLAVICALSSGATMTLAAEQAGVHRNTIHNWRRNLLPFQHALADAQYDRAIHFREKAEELVDLAIKTIQEILADPKAPAGVRLKAALAIMQTASTPPPPKKQIQLDIEKIVIDQSIPEPVIPKSVIDDQPAPAPVVHNDAQPICPDSPSSEADSSIQPVHNPAQPQRQTRAKIGRNEACPCGSGKKYKRCCLNKTVRTEFVQRLACAA